MSTFPNLDACYTLLATWQSWQFDTSDRSQYMELPVPELLYKSLDQPSGRPFLDVSKPAVIKGIILYATYRIGWHLGPDVVDANDEYLYIWLCGNIKFATWMAQRARGFRLVGFIYFLSSAFLRPWIRGHLWPLCYLFSCLFCHIFMSWLRFARDTGSLRGFLLLGVECLDELNVTKYHHCKSLSIGIQELPT
jgi:hypothetical protein